MNSDDFFFQNRLKNASYSSPTPSSSSPHSNRPLKNHNSRISWYKEDEEGKHQENNCKQDGETDEKVLIQALVKEFVIRLMKFDAETIMNLWCTYSSFADNEETDSVREKELDVNEIVKKVFEILCFSPFKLSIEDQYLHLFDKNHASVLSIFKIPISSLSEDTQNAISYMQKADYAKFFGTRIFQKDMKLPIFTDFKWDSVIQEHFDRTRMIFFYIWCSLMFNFYYHEKVKGKGLKINYQATLAAVDNIFIPSITSFLTAYSSSFSTSPVVAVFDGNKNDDKPRRKELNEIFLIYQEMTKVSYSKNEKSIEHFFLYLKKNIFH